MLSLDKMMKNEVYKYIQSNPALNIVGILRGLKGLMANSGTKEVL
jgi:hypothetical protein